MKRARELSRRPSEIRAEANKATGDTLGDASSAWFDDVPEEEAADVRAVAVKKKRPTLTSTHLIEQGGLADLYERGKSLKLCVGGTDADRNATRNIRSVLHMYEAWSRDLFPQVNFTGLTARIRKELSGVVARQFMQHVRSGGNPRDYGFGNMGLSANQVQDPVPAAEPVRQSQEPEFGHGSSAEQQPVVLDSGVMRRAEQPQQIDASLAVRMQQNRQRALDRLAATRTEASQASQIERFSHVATSIDDDDVDDIDADAMASLMSSIEQQHQQQKQQQVPAAPSDPLADVATEPTDPLADLSAEPSDPLADPVADVATEPTDPLADEPAIGPDVGLDDAAAAEPSDPLAAEPSDPLAQAPQDPLADAGNDTAQKLGDNAMVSMPDDPLDSIEATVIVQDDTEP